MKLTLRALTFVLAAALLLGAALPVAAEDGNVTYTGNSGKVILEPGTEYSPTDLFPDLKDVMPGDTLTQRIVVKNEASRNVHVTVYLRALGGHEDPESEYLLSQLQLKVTQVGKEDPLFEAPADETAQLTDWVSLGSVKSGGTVELEVTLTVPTTLDNTFKNLAGYLDWQFRVEEIPSSDVPPTGDQMDLTLYITLAAVSGGAIVVVVVILVILKKKDKKKED